MAGVITIPNLFTGVTTGTTPNLDADFAAVAAYVNDPTNRIIEASDTGPSPNNYVIAPSPAVPNFSNPFIVWSIANHTNTGDSVANVSALGNKHVYKDSTTGPTLLTGGEIVATNIFGLEYDANLNSGAGGYHLLNLASPFTAAGTPQTINPYSVGAKGASGHGLNGTPRLIIWYIENLSSELGYGVGERVFVNVVGDAAAGSTNGFTSSADNVNIYITTSSANTLLILDRTSNQPTLITASKWKIVGTPYM